MEIIVEIGTNQQKELICQELETVRTMIETLSLPSQQISKLIVPANFDETVNSLQGSNNYRSERGNLAVAKNVGSTDILVGLYKM